MAVPVGVGLNVVPGVIGGGHGVAWASWALGRLVDWFVALHGPATVLNVRYGVDGVECLGPGCAIGDGD